MGSVNASDAQGVMLRERLRRLNETSLHAAEGLDFDHVLEIVAHSACVLTGGRFGGITVVDASGDIEAFVTSGLTSQEHDLLCELPDGIKFAEHLMELRDPLRVLDLGKYFASRGLPGFEPRLDLGPVLAASIRSRGESVGTIYVSKPRHATGFTDEDETSLAIFALQTALVITNARRLRDEQRARADVEALIDTSPVGVMVLDARLGDLKLANQEFSRISSELREQDESPTELFEQLVVRRADGQEFSLGEHPLGQILRNGEIVRAERIVLTRPGGRSVAVLVNATPIRNAEDSVESTVVTLQDLTPREDLERRRADTLGLAINELRQPLVSIKGSAAMLLTSLTELDPAESADLARIIDAEADHLRDLIGELREMAQIHTDTPPLAHLPRSDADAIASRHPARPASAARILVVDVDPTTQRHISDTLAAAGYSLTHAVDAQQALSDAASNDVDLVLAGIAYPANGSVETTRSMCIESGARVILVVDYGLDEAVQGAVESGAADYIVKPFSPTELLARVRSALHRQEATTPDEFPQFVLDGLVVDFASRTVWVDNQPADVTETEIRLLCELATNAGKVLSYSHLMRHVWMSDSPNPAGPVRSAVKRLRRKLNDDARNPSYIVTVPRAGYRIGTPQRAN